MERKKRKKIERVWDDFCRGKISFEQYKRKRKKIEAEAEENRKRIKFNSPLDKIVMDLLQVHGPRKRNWNAIVKAYQSHDMIEMEGLFIETK